MRPDDRIRAKNLRINRDAVAVLKLMYDGQSLHLELCDAGSRWRLSGSSKVNDSVARYVITKPEVVGGGDGLFPEANPQTWRIK